MATKKKVLLPNLKEEKELRKDLIQNPEKYPDIISAYTETPKHKLLICAPATLEMGKTEAGIFVPDAAEIHAFDNQGQHGQQRQKSMYDSQVAVVIKRSSKCEEGCKPGDVIRYNPMYAGEFKFKQHQLIQVNEIDMKIVCGNIFE